jgi:hypothetical protein
MRNAPLLLAALAAALSTPLAMGQNLFKCVDDKGHATYSDRACALAPRPTPPPPSPRPAPVPAAAAKASAPAAVPGIAASAPTVTKLTPSVVEDVLRRAMVLAERSDYRAQCALAAPDLSFQVTDHSKSPATVHSGGRSEICATQRESAQGLQAAGASIAPRMGKLDIRVNADGTQATAKFESFTNISVQGEHVLIARCSHEEVLGLYSGNVLYKRLTRACWPVG